MADQYFAEIDGTGLVLRVVVCNDPAWLVSRLGGTWIETLIDDTEQKYAGIGKYYSDIPPDQFVPRWFQPVSSEDAYPNGFWVWHNGVVWRSLQAANVFEPGVASWREMLTEWPEWVQPTGAQDAYQIGEKISWEGDHYISVSDGDPVYLLTYKDHSTNWQCGAVKIVPDYP